ncbi:MAG: FAD:protein FMN transferase [Proteobacteria bacterium]|nr:FAD:protein FMN transferase [Pseudomonadota bacterium]
MHGLVHDSAHLAIDSAFSEIAQVHALMSFHEETSDVSRLNREAHIRPVAVDRRTYEVLRHARQVSALCDGAFDVTVAADLVASGILPAPRGVAVPEISAMWRDIELLEECRVKFRRPLWIDLGGIAKGYAVDRAMEIIAAFSPSQACVNAGGDLRVLGQASEKVRLAAPDVDNSVVPLIELSNGSLASSCGRATGNRGSAKTPGVHIDTRCGRTISVRQFVSVAAPRCIDADALTKVVMTRGACSLPALTAFNAQAVVHDIRYGWRELGGHA